MAPVQSYEIPDRHRQAVCLLTPADVFPYSSATVNQTDGWASMQIDHTIPWHPDHPDQSQDGEQTGGRGSGTTDR